VDEVWLAQNSEYKRKKFQSVGKGAVELGSEEERTKASEEFEEKREEFKNFLECMQSKLEADVKEVRLSTRLTDSAACLVGEEGDIPPQLAEMMRQAGQEVPDAKRILEINPEHPILKKLRERYDANPTDGTIEDFARLLFGQALLAEGGMPEDPARFSKRLSELMVRALS